MKVVLTRVGALPNRPLQCNKMLWNHTILFGSISTLFKLSQKLVLERTVFFSILTVGNLEAYVGNLGANFGISCFIINSGHE